MCNANAPEFRRAEDEFGDEIVVLHVSEKERTPEVEAFAQQYDLGMPVLMDRDGAVGLKYGLRATPTTFFINADGVIEDLKLGFLDLAWIREKVAGLD